MGHVCENWYLVYFLFSGLGDEHGTWATSFRNTGSSTSVAAQMRVVCGVVWLAVAGRLSGEEDVQVHT